MASSSTFSSPCRFHHLTPKSISSSKHRTTKFPLRRNSISPSASLSDPFVLQIAETLEDSTSSLSSSKPLQNLRDTSSESLLSLSWPTRKDEPFRFTDTSFIKQSQIHPVSNPIDSNLTDFISSYDNSDDTQNPNLVIIDGHIVHSLSKLSEFPENVYIGSISDISSDEIMKKVLAFGSKFQNGDLFWSLNGIGAPDVTVVYVPSGCHVDKPLRFRFYSSQMADAKSNHLPMSNPRVLVLVEKGGEIGIIEEYLGGEDEDKCYWANSVMEVLIGEGGKVTHSYVQQQASNAAHMKWTSVLQESSSTYELVEISTGGKLSRHNLHIQQVGTDTFTDLSSFHLCVRNQTQDLHSKLVLDHPRGTAQQLHKCILAHSLGQAVFDGNVKVNRFAQQTNAAQLARSLPLEPSATVNLMPNLQIIADDVKCTHGATIGGFEDEQLFYLVARGIDLKTARKALVLAFGAEVIARLPCDSLRKNVESHVQRLLKPILE